MAMIFLGLSDGDSPHQALSWCVLMGGLHSALMSLTNCFPGSWNKYHGNINELLSFLLNAKTKCFFVVLLHTVV